jgi:hypothetical protein
MRIVSEQSEQEIKKRETAAAVTSELRDFAANFLRVVRGAGDTFRLWHGMKSCSEAAEAFYKAHGEWPSAQLIHDALDQRLAHDESRPLVKERLGNEYPTERDMAIDAICRAALQIVASTLVDQPTQRSGAEHALHAATEELEKVREARRRDRTC